MSRRVLILDLGSEASVCSFVSPPSSLASQSQILKTTSLSHPRLSQPLTYLSLASRGVAGGADGGFGATTLLEVSTLLPSKYSSFFVNSNVLEDGSFNVATPVDPLYLALPSLPSVLSKYSPFDQFKTELRNDDLAKSLTEVQLRNVCDVSDALGDDMLLYKFNEEKALVWLKKKFERVHALVKRRCLERSSSKSSAFSASFELDDTAPNDGSKAAPIATPSSSHQSQEESLTPEDASACRRAACLLVSEYLSPLWCSKLCGVVGVDAASLDESAANKGAGAKRKAAWESHDPEMDRLNEIAGGGGGGVGGDREKKEPVKETAAAKSLKKASEGTKSIASFFGVKK